MELSRLLVTQSSIPITLVIGTNSINFIDFDNKIDLHTTIYKNNMSVFSASFEKFYFTTT